MLVLAGRMMSEKRQSFSSHGCWATMHSTWLVPSAVSVSLPPFQQVVRQGVSVQIIRMGDWPGRGNVYFLNWLATFPSMEPTPLNFNVPSVCRWVWTRVLGNADSCQLAMEERTVRESRSMISGFQNEVPARPSIRGMPKYVS